MRYKNIRVFAISLLLVWGAGCTNRSNVKAPVLQGAYLGQQPPGMQAQMFAKDIVSTDRIEHSAPAFSPDGMAVLWGTIDTAGPSLLWEMTLVSNVWSKPAQPSFSSGKYDDMYPFFSADGKRLLFGSRRPLPGGVIKDDMRMWIVDRRDTGWGQPYLLDAAISIGFEYAHSWAANGNLYFSASRPAQERPDFNVYCAKFVNGNYQQPVMLDTTINNGSYVDGPYVSPDESFLIFESNRAGGLGNTDLYICFKQPAGKWDKPVNMGPKINTSFFERFAGMSPDGKYLFFGRDSEHRFYDAYWIDAAIIEEVRRGLPQAGK